jgi:hypothetical protein
MDAYAMLLTKPALSFHLSMSVQGIKCYQVLTHVTAQGCKNKKIYKGYERDTSEPVSILQMKHIINS